MAKGLNKAMTKVGGVPWEYIRGTVRYHGWCLVQTGKPGPTHDSDMHPGPLDGKLALLKANYDNLPI